MDLAAALGRARHHAQSVTELRGGRPAPDLDQVADGRMCRLLLMQLCRLDGDACEAWMFCHEEGCTEGPSVLAARHPDLARLYQGEDK